MKKISVVKEAICSGKLPDRSAERTWAGRGCGAPCAICGRPINADELEYELEFATGDNTTAAGTHSAAGKPLADYHVHIGCFWAWESERRKRASKPSGETVVELSGAIAEARVAKNGWEAPGSEGST
jgi:hypothetical protein